MTAIILSIGDELALGQTVDTNSAWLSRELAAVGCCVGAHITVPDDQPAIERAIRNAARECDFLLISGGLGPTEDDLTRQALAAVMGEPLEENAQWIGELRKFFEARGRPMPPMNRIQAMIPRTARMIFNTAGTAAGIDALLPSPGGTSAARPTRIFAMPGVPKEMKIMFAREVLPHVQEAGGGAVILSRTLHTFGLGESAVAEKLGDLMRRDRNPSVGTTVSAGIVSLRVNARFLSLAEAESEVEKTVAACRAALSDLIFGQDDQTLQERVAALLAGTSGHHPFTISTAESCTGGLLSKYLTDVPGSSAWFSQGWVTYSNQAKIDQLGVPADLIANHGAVSKPVAEAMARGALRRSGSDGALAISGIAGPDGGTEEKPVGTVCIALVHAGGANVRTFHFPGDREMIRDRSAKMALSLLRFHLLGRPVPF